MKRYPIRGFFAGLLAGISVAVFLILGGIHPAGTNTPWIVVLVVIVLGVLWAMFGPARARKSGGTPAPASVDAPAPGEEPPPDSAPTAGEGAPPE